MNTNSILKEAMNLRPAERLRLIEMLTKSLSKPDENVEQTWAEESEKRYEALRTGKVKTISLDEIAKRYK
ncbi:MAG: addiction module protein [Ignavibacteria bacterium GWB2_35_6b]|nr:MAG: addiction module protein [Ignavibacteria bacterium GWB2_35_6b]